MFCASCGKQLDEGTKFCAGCGSPVEAAGAPPVQSYQQGPSYTAPPSQGYQQTQTGGTQQNAWQYFTGALKKYTVFQGRARRAEFWWFLLFIFLITQAVSYIGGRFLGLEPIVSWIGGEPVVWGNILSVLANLVFFLPSLAVWIRRMHDVGKSGWYVLIPVYDIILCFYAGNTGPNQYGNDPKVA